MRVTNKYRSHLSVGNNLSEWKFYSAPSGGIYDNLSAINRDTWTLYSDKTYKIGNSAYGNSGAQANWQNMHNNDFKLNAKIKMDVTKYLPKIIKYSDTGTATMNPYTWMTFFTCSRQWYKLCASIY